MYLQQCHSTRTMSKVPGIKWIIHSWKYMVSFPRCVQQRSQKITNKRDWHSHNSLVRTVTIASSLVFATLNLAAPASDLEMFHQLLTFALLNVLTVSAAPVHPYPSTSEPTKVTAMAKPTVVVPTPISTITANLQARQREWSPSAPAWSEPV